MANRIDTIESYLSYVGTCRDQAFGQRFRRQFCDSRGTAELAMLAAPTEEEYKGFCRLVDAMTDEEKARLELLTDDQVRFIAARADIDPGCAAIFINGYVLAKKRNRGS